MRQNVTSLGHECYVLLLILKDKTDVFFKRDQIDTRLKQRDKFYTCFKQSNLAAFKELQNSFINSRTNWRMLKCYFEDQIFFLRLTLHLCKQ